MLKNELSLLKKENKLREEFVIEEDQAIIKKMLTYMSAKRIGLFELEVIHKELIGMALEAGQRGESLHATIGKDEKAFCDDMIEGSKKQTLKETLLITFQQFIFCYATYIVAFVLFLSNPMHVELNSVLLIFLPLWSLGWAIMNRVVGERYIYEKGIKKYIPTVLVIFSIFVLCEIEDMLQIPTGIYVNGILFIGMALLISLGVRLYYNHYIHHVSKKYQWQD